MKKILKTIGIVLGVIYFICGLLLFCSYTREPYRHEFRGWLLYMDGPYEGKIVDDETNRPIEDATVFAYWVVDKTFLTLSFSSLCDAVETTTDKNGEFVLSKTFCINLYPLAEMLIPRIVIFKSGYDSYPPKLPVIDPEKASDKEREDARIYFGEHITEFTQGKKNVIKLRKAKNDEERRWIVKGIGLDIHDGIEISERQLQTNAKGMILAISEEEKHLGLDQHR